MDQDKKSLSAVIVVIMTILFFAIVSYWVNFCEINIAVPAQGLLNKINRRSALIRLIFVVLVILFTWLSPIKVRIKDEYIKNSLLIVMFILAVLIIMGCIQFYLYDLFVYPIIYLSYMPVVLYAISSLRNKYHKDETIFGISNEESDFYFNFTTEDGELTIHKPQQNLWIDGGPGSGKSDTFIKSIIEQCTKRNYAGLIYDWEGDPHKHESPILSKVAYGCIQEYRNKGCILNFAFINFTDMLRTKRVNVFSEKYVPEGSEALFIRNIATTLMKNLEPSWKEKTDFWANNAINYVYSVAYKCYKERDKGINTLPHVITFCLKDSDSVFRWLSEDQEIALNMSSMLTAWKMGASQQTAGAVSSAQTPLSLLNNKNIFWVLSANNMDEFNLDITNKNNPSLLCIGNAPSIKEAVSPAISCIMSVVMSQMNNPGKAKSVLLVDEFPTVNIQGIDIFIGTARKHYVSTILALQDFNQAVRDYGEKSAQILKTSCGNQFFGMTGNDNTAKAVQDLLGEVKEVSESFTTQDTGSGSQSESLQKEKAIKGRDVAGQSTGHFIGKVANGNPPFFNTQFNREVGFQSEIPHFSVVVDTKDFKKNKELMDAIVVANYENILEVVESILIPYQQVKEEA